MTPDCLRLPCHLGSLLLLVRHLPSPALILVWFQVSQAGVDVDPPGPSDCAGQQLPDRILCGSDGIHPIDCMDLGCCFDQNFNMCFFPVSCEQFATLAGGYSALMLLPGKDRPNQGSVSMLEGGNWCSRDPHHSMGSLKVEMEIPEIRLVYLTTTFTVSESFIHPFTFQYSIEDYRRWLPLREIDSHNVSEATGFTHKVVNTLYANRLKILPKRDKERPCVKVDIVTCPGVPPTEAPENVTEAPPPTTEAPTPEPEMVKGVDERPTAIAVGSFVVTILAVLFALIVLIDLSTFAKNFMYMKRSVASYLRHRRRQRALNKAIKNGSVCRGVIVGGGGAQQLDCQLEVKAKDELDHFRSSENASSVSDELLLSSSVPTGYDITRDMEAQHALVHPEMPDDMGIGDWMTESDDASLVQYETVF